MADTPSSAGRCAPQASGDIGRRSLGSAGNRRRIRALAPGLAAISTERVDAARAELGTLKQPALVREVVHIVEGRRFCLQARALHYSHTAMDALAKMVEDNSPGASNIRLEAAKFLVGLSCYKKLE